MQAVKSPAQFPSLKEADIRRFDKIQQIISGTIMTSKCFQVCCSALCLLIVLVLH